MLRFHIEHRGHASPQAFFAFILHQLIDKSGFLGSLVGISSACLTVFTMDDGAFIIERRRLHIDW